MMHLPGRIEKIIEDVTEHKKTNGLNQLFSRRFRKRVQNQIRFCTGNSIFYLFCENQRKTKLLY